MTTSCNKKALPYGQDQSAHKKKYTIVLARNYCNLADISVSSLKIYF